MLLEDRNAVVYGGGGAIGGAVALAFAREGAKVFLAGRTPATLDRVAEEIFTVGGVAETARVDALDELAVEKHIGEVVEQAGGIDVSFNAISIKDVQLTPLVEMPREDFASPIVAGTTTHLFTARAARRMAERGSGVILTLLPRQSARTSRVSTWEASGSRARRSRLSRNSSRWSLDHAASA